MPVQITDGSRRAASNSGHEITWHPSCYYFFARKLRLTDEKIQKWLTRVPARNASGWSESWRPPVRLHGGIKARETAFDTQLLCHVHSLEAHICHRSDFIRPIHGNAPR